MTKITDVVDLEKQGEIAVLLINNPPVNALSVGVTKGNGRWRKGGHGGRFSQSDCDRLCRSYLYRRGRYYRIRKAAAGARIRNTFWID